MSKQPTAEKSSADILHEVIQDMHAQEQIVTRETLATHAGLGDMTKTQIDDRLSYLENNGRIVRVQRGVYVPAEQHKPSRHISRSILPDGTSVLEIGEQVLILTPREARMVGEAMAGAAQQFVAIEMGHQAAHVNRELAMQLKDMRKQIAKLNGLVQTTQQLPLDVSA